MKLENVLGKPPNCRQALLHKDITNADMSARSKRSVKSDCTRRLRSSQLEEQLVRKRQAEYERLNFWNNNSTYFKTWEFNTSLYSTWADHSSAEHMEKMEKLKKKQEALEERRKKLKKLLEDEERSFAEELRSKSKKPVLLEDMNAANIGFILKEEEARRRERDLKMHLYWRQNQPSLREFERKQHYDHVRVSWLQQVMEKRRERELEEKKMMEHVKELKRMQEEREETERQLNEERKRTEKELRDFLEKQIELSKCKEEQQAVLKSEEKETMKVQNELDELIEERKKREARKKRIDLSASHKQQYQLLLKKRAREFEENLEYDRRFLERLENEKKYEENINAERVSRFRESLKIARDAFRKQAEIEKLRVEQAEYLFDEEAKKAYEKQEAKWKMEDEARQKLLDDVLEGLQSQVKEKLLKNWETQEELEKERKLVLKTVEQANNELKEFQEKTKKALQDWKKDLDQQILEKKLQFYYTKKKEEEDKENFLKAKREEEEKLCQELTKMHLAGYQPKDSRRKNVRLM